MFLRSLVFCCLYYQLLSNVHINIYIQRLFCPQRPRKRCSREETTRVTSALWGYQFTALHVTGVLPDVVSFSTPWFLLLAFDRIKIFFRTNASFLKNGLVSWWFVTHDPFWRPSPITTSIIQHKYVYINKLSRNPRFLLPLWLDLSTHSILVISNPPQCIVWLMYVCA